MTHFATLSRTAWKRVLIGTSVGLLLCIGGVRPARAVDAGAITEDNVTQRITEAKTPADHEALAAFYRAQAAAAAQSVTRHEAMLKSYESVAGRSKENMRSHCEALIHSYKQEQKQYDDLAQEHAQTAKALQSKTH